jgi:hypothetical protein
MEIGQKSKLPDFFFSNIIGYMPDHSACSDKELNIAIFERKDSGRVLWQPRLEYWYETNKRRGSLPPDMGDFSLIDFYDYCRASIRYFTKPLKQRYKKTEVIERWLNDYFKERIFKTPIGELREVHHYDEIKLTSYPSEFRIKTLKDFELQDFLLLDEEWYWDDKEIKTAVSLIGSRGAPQFYFRRSPLQSLFIELLGFEKTIFMMHDHPTIIESYFEAASAADGPMYKILCDCPVSIMNFGENIDAHMVSPPIWDNFLLPYYQIRNRQLKEAGKYTHIHIDGAMKPLIGRIRTSPFDGIEACTPLPQGDVTLEEIKQAVGDRVLLDGIPAIYFLPEYPVEAVKETAMQLINMFHPRLVLGVSDELPPDADIERVRLVGELVESL